MKRTSTGGVKQKWVHGGGAKAIKIQFEKELLVWIEERRNNMLIFLRKRVIYNIKTMYKVGEQTVQRQQRMTRKIYEPKRFITRKTMTRQKKSFIDDPKIGSLCNSCSLTLKTVYLWN